MPTRTAPSVSSTSEEAPAPTPRSDARSIPEPNASADAVALLGPLYHLTDQTQRASALLEARRVLKPGGVVAAVGNPDPVRYPQWFTTAYLHLPEELADEVRHAGFDAVSLLGIEGPGWAMQEHWMDPDRREQMLFAARAVESESSLSGLSANLLAAGTKH